MEHQEYPRWMYHDDGRGMQALSSEHEAALPAGWRREPSPAHIAANAHRPPSVVQPVDMSGRDEFIDKIIDRLEERGFVSSASGDDQPMRRGRGRPKRNHPKNVTQARAGSRSASTADEGDE